MREKIGKQKQKEQARKTNRKRGSEVEDMDDTQKREALIRNWINM